MEVWFWGRHKNGPYYTKSRKVEMPHKSRILVVSVFIVIFEKETALFSEANICVYVLFCPNTFERRHKRGLKRTKFTGLGPARPNCLNCLKMFLLSKAMIVAYWLKQIRFRPTF
jgi:hypothetical protein